MAPTAGLLDRIVRQSGVPNLIEALTERLSPTDLQSLLLEAYAQRAAEQRPARILERYEHDRFTRPSRTDVLTMLAFDQLAFTHATRMAPPFQPMELAPLCPLGTNSAVAAISQKVAVATIRNSEVVSDSTNVLALESALRRRVSLREGRQSVERVRLCASQRLVRAQRFTRPEALAHFRLFALCTAGRDEGQRRFEWESLREQISFFLVVLADWQKRPARLAGIRVALTSLAPWTSVDRTRAAVIDPLSARFPDVSLGWEPDRTSGRGYYTGLCFHIYGRDSAGREYQLADGGFTDWTQRLLSDRSERLLISGIGTERLCTTFA